MTPAVMVMPFVANGWGKALVMPVQTTVVSLVGSMMFSIDCMLYPAASSDPFVGLHALSCGCFALRGWHVVLWGPNRVCTAAIVFCMMVLMASASGNGCVVGRFWYIALAWVLVGRRYAGWGTWLTVSVGCRG